MGYDLLAVGIGGAIGACLRYALSLLPWKGSFPLLTCMTNVLGSFIIGFLFGASHRFEHQQRWLLLCKTGICGGFTTFSTFSLESMQLLQQHATGMALLYMGSSVLLCLVGVMAGSWLGQRC